ncbi:MAG: DUF1732 domain-containing protein [Gemmatimonadota bacterium]
MIRSMTGFGDASVTISLEPGEDAGTGTLPEIDHVRAERYVELLRELGVRYGLAGPSDAQALARMPEVLRAPDPREGARGVEADDLRRVLAEAARGVVALRDAEGARLQEDLEERLAALERGLKEIEERAPLRLMAERDRLRAQVRELAESEDVDDERLAREVAYLAEKWDINEEIVRLRSHLELFRETLAGDGEEPAGKRLSFVVQEMHREVNTIGSKANDAGITRASVAMKEEIEKLREQVENVE